jgi:hypothetical protein
MMGSLSLLLSLLTSFRPEPQFARLYNSLRATGSVEVLAANTYS